MNTDTVSAAGALAVEAGGTLPGGPQGHVEPPAKSRFTYYCGECWKPCEKTDRGVVCTEHYFDRTPLCDMCRKEHSVISEYGQNVCLSGDCLARARGGRPDEELAYTAGQVDVLAKIVTAAVLILEAGV